jgi:CelD/BcsL family acetyltransferase involved in cellulose biosynthesis
MSVRLVAGRELSAELVAAWRAIRGTDVRLASPFFCPEFTSAVALSKEGVFVAVFEDDGVQALLPFETVGQVGRSVGCLISDLQGLVARPEYVVDIRAAMQAGRLLAFDFDHLSPGQQSFAPYARGWALSPRIDISREYEAYVCDRRMAGTRQIDQCEVARRKLEREVGPVSFVAHSPDAKALGKILGWKSLQYRRTRNRDVLEIGWVRETIERIRALDEPSGFSGCLSLLYAGDELIAGHFGMRTPTVWHYWFTAYNTRYAKYSPGLIMLLEIAKSAAQSGAETVELGKGTSLYKQRLMNAHTLVGHGHIEVPSWFTLGRKLSRQVRSAARKSAEPARQIVRRLQGLPENGGSERVHRLVKRAPFGR